MGEAPGHWPRSGSNLPNRAMLLYCVPVVGCMSPLVNTSLLTFRKPQKDLTSSPIFTILRKAPNVIQTQTLNEKIRIQPGRRFQNYVAGCDTH